MEKINLKEIVYVLVQNRKAILGLTFAAALVSSLASFLITPKYKSIAVVYPVNLSPSSEESNTEQLLQYFNSENVKNRVVEKNKLFEHYKIDSKMNEAKSLFDYHYQSNVSITPTIYESVEISVKDESPVMAQKIAQSLIDETNQFISSLKKERLNEYLRNSSSAINREFMNIDTIINKINSLRNEIGIIDMNYQSKYLSKKMFEGKPLSDDEEKLAKGLKENRMNIEKLKLNSDGKVATLNYFENEYSKYMLDYLGQIKYTNVVSNPTLPDKKCYPVRWVIVTLSSLSAFALALLYFLFFSKGIKEFVKS